jgi:hypothetical protein
VARLASVPVATSVAGAVCFLFTAEDLWSTSGNYSAMDTIALSPANVQLAAAGVFWVKLKISIVVCSFYFGLYHQWLLIAACVAIGPVAGVVAGVFGGQVGHAENIHAPAWNANAD